MVSVRFLPYSDIEDRGVALGVSEGLSKHTDTVTVIEHITLHFNRKRPILSSVLNRAMYELIQHHQISLSADDSQVYSPSRGAVRWMRALSCPSTVPPAHPVPSPPTLDKMSLDPVYGILGKQPL